MTGSRHTPVRYAAGLLAGMAAVGGCTTQEGGGGAGGGPVPPPSATSVPVTTSHAATPSRTPDGAAARNHSVKGGADFIRFYFAELNRAYTTPASASLAQLGGPGCDFCDHNLERIVELERGGGRYTSPLVAISSPMPFEGSPNGQRYYQVTVSQLGAVRVDAQGHQLGVDQTGRAVVNAVIGWTPSGWRLMGVEDT